jgi:DHA3 family macrolide efflux protein-like MFS transporter
MMIADILRGLLVLSIPLFIKANQILFVYLAIFLIFSRSRFFIPSKMALIPELVSKDKLLVANTLSDTTHMIGNVMGLVVAGVIVNITFIGAIGGFYIDSATFFISAGLIAMIAKRKFVGHVKEDIVVTGKAIENSLRRTIFSEIKEGLSYIAKYRDMRFVVYVFFLLMSGIGTISCVIIVFIQHAFGTSTRDLGFLGMFLVGGLLAGSVIYTKFCQNVPKKKAIHLSFAASGIAIILFTIGINRCPNLLLGAFLVGLLGLTISPIMVTTNTLAHETIPQEARGRIFSSLEAVIHLAFLVFMFIAAYAAKYIDRFWIIIAVGVVYFVCGTVRMVTSSRPSLS